MRDHTRKNAGDVRFSDWKKMNESENEFEFDDDLTPPEPFDRTIAYLDVKPVSNDTRDAIDVSVTASFGHDVVEIPLSDGGSLEVQLGILEAIIVSRYVNCNPTTMEADFDHKGYSFTTKFGAGESSVAEGEIGGGLGLEAQVGETTAAARANAEVQRSRRSANTEELSTEGQRNYEQVELSSDQIRIRPNPDGSPLVGQLVPGDTCWRVLPDNLDQRFGMLTELQVRRSWIELKNPVAISKSNRLVAALKNAWDGEDTRDEFHREAFKLLVSHLVVSGLQSSYSNTEATLAARAVLGRPRPKQEGHEHMLALPIARRLNLRVDELVTVLVEDVDNVVDFLKSQGIPNHEIEEITPTDHSHLDEVEPIAPPHLVLVAMNA
jgi:hypothetical protein